MRSPNRVLSHIKVRCGQTEGVEVLHGDRIIRNVLPASRNRFDFGIVRLPLSISRQFAFRNIFENLRYFCERIGSLQKPRARLVSPVKLRPPNFAASARDNKFRQLFRTVLSTRVGSIRNGSLLRIAPASSASIILTMFLHFYGFQGLAAT